MNRKSLFYLILTAGVAGILTLVYFISRPQSAPIVTSTTSSNNLDYSEVNSFVYKQDKAICLFFYSSADPDSQLVVAKMLDVIKEEQGISAFSRLFYVDLADLPPDLPENYTKNNWGFGNYPAFTVMKISKSSVNITKVLEWDRSDPFSIDDVRAWLKEQEVIS